MVERRLAGEPLQYVIGHWPFRDLELMVDRRVLIPRPETEITAEVALEEAVRAGARREPSNPWGGSGHAFPVADLGTGSGALALALASELPEAEVWATDADADALAVAGANLAGAGRPPRGCAWRRDCGTKHSPRPCEGGWSSSCPTRPMWAKRSTPPSRPRCVTTSRAPRSVSGPRGTEALEELLDGAPGWLAPEGALVLELAPHQATPLAERARLIGYRQVEVRPDLAGRDRVLVARR